ncbi:MAG TPA: homocysteine S-methyltransferase family protein [Candidatus Eisenbergiella merdigallinarum]|uniref:Methionine synthase n=1 Tax=Candidatus Eisenbergiella merdigallinarum TaxID=2838552 RepID=A0A9D2SC08_9FIRM|nr:homocysteine S-methyltransferase family protein [Candidatus Eisenbergiella merdigallinarum]
MTREEFRKRISGGLLFLDGATGSNLQKCGMPPGVCPEQWIAENPGHLIRLQQDYVRAGSDLIYAPTFSANRIKLREYGLEGRIRELNRRLVELSREAAGDGVLVAGDLTMTGEQLAPLGKLDFEELVEVYREQGSCLSEAGVDLFVVETMMSLQESRAALIALRESFPDMPVMVTMTFQADGRSLFGTDAGTAAVVLESLGADAIGANCSTGPAGMEAVIRKMAEVSSLPLIAKPNAGLPALDGNGQTVYGMGPEEFGAEMEILRRAGASLLGGCCGTTPDHIRRLKEGMAGKAPGKRRPSAKRFLSSERSLLEFGLNDPFLIVGERINPTGKKKLQEQLRQGNFEMVTQFAQEQEACGAAVLDVNLGMNGIDEKQAMLRALEEIGEVTNLPLSIDSSHVDVMEAALRRYPGRALINSISLETGKSEQLLALAKKYGAMFILLPLSDRGLPETAEEKIAIIDELVDRAKAAGLRDRDIVVDGLVTTVGANPKAALETLETIRYCRNRGLATACGLSNISFGLPERSCINTAFLTMAISAGLTMAIANPAQELMTAAAFASDLLMNKNDAAIRYIDRAKEKKGGEEAPAAQKPQERGGRTGTLEQIGQAVLKGNRGGIEALTRQALEGGADPQEILRDWLMPAIDEVGNLFDQGKYFLPQLIAGAEAMKRSIGILEPLLQKEGPAQGAPAVVLATVEGDIHDIGKNLVALMMRNYGFTVIDLGKDVPKERIVEAALEHDAKIIGLSALMTTTMKEMKNVIEYARSRGVTAKIIVGGAVITPEYAEEIHADGYSRDAAEAVRLAGRLLGRTDGADRGENP